MNIIINCRQMDLTKNLKDYAEEKIGKFKRYLGNITEATVTMSVEKNQAQSGSPHQGERFVYTGRKHNRRNVHID